MQAEIELHRPQNLAEALALLAQYGPAGKPLAGGTNIVGELRAGHHKGQSLVDLGRCPELRGLQLQDGQVVIGWCMIRHPCCAARAGA